MATHTDRRTPLRRAREARGLTRKALAGASAVSLRTVTNAELARHEPHPASKAQLAQALEMDPRELWPPNGEAA
jgi:transcriptional regulator with XRE-family HTH domain